MAGRSSDEKERVGRGVGRWVEKEEKRREEKMGINDLRCKGKVTVMDTLRKKARGRCHTELNSSDPKSF